MVISTATANRAEEIRLISTGIKALFTSGHTVNIIYIWGIIKDGINFIA